MAVDIIARGMAAGSVKPGSDGKIPAEYLPSYVDDITDLVAVSSTAPATCSTGDKYYNTTDKLIYTATADNTWGTTGETPEDGKIYLDISANPATSYRWSGTDLVEVGQDLSNYMTLDSAQTVTGTKTFNVLPESSVVPTTDNQLVNKKYVDDNAGGGGYSNIFSSDVNSLNNDSATKTKLAEFITNNKNKTVFIFVASSSTGNYSTNGAAIFKMYINGIFSNTTYHGVKISGSPYGETYQSGNILDVHTLSVTGTWSDNVFTISSVEVWTIDQPDCYLSTSNSHVQVYTPTQPYNPATKKYVDDNISQVSTLPTAASTNEGRIYQYTGETDSSYTNGYFYQCVSDGNDPAAYSWEQVNVQPNGGSSSKIQLGLASQYTQSNPLDLDLLDIGSYELLVPNGSSTMTMYLKMTYNGNIVTGTYSITGVPTTFRIDIDITNKDLSSSNRWITIGSISNMSISNYYSRIGYYSKEIQLDTVDNRIKTDSSGFSSSVNIDSIDKAQTITAKKTFDVLPESSVVPTTNNQLVNKKYVDDNALLTLYTQSGLNEYDSTATYAVGDYVYYNNLIYKCNTAISVAEAWDSTHWTQKTYLEYLQDVIVAPFAQTIAQRLAALTSLPVSDLQVVNELPQNQEQGTMYFVEGE